MTIVRRTRGDLAAFKDTRNYSLHPRRRVGLELALFSLDTLIPTTVVALPIAQTATHHRQHLVHILAIFVRGV